MLNVMGRMHKYLGLSEQLLQPIYINVALVRLEGSYSLIYSLLQDYQLGGEYMCFSFFSSVLML